MGFTAPAVHYSALATLPPGLTTSKSQQSLKQTTTIKSKLSQIFKKFIHNPPIKQPSETIEKENEKLLTIDKTPNNNNSGNRTITEQESSLNEPSERLPFTEPYFSTLSKKEKIPFELSTYHKHCIHQQKYITQKQYHHESSQSNRSNLPNYQLKNSIDHSSSINKTLPISTSIENDIAFRYASQKNTITNSYAYRSSSTQHLRRLHSKSKFRSISNETKTSSPSLSIAHRIELLKQSMHNNQLEYHQYKSELKPPSTIDSIHKQTQTNENPSKSSEIHHIHHHHIHSSSYLSIQWRTYFSIIGTILILFVFFIEFLTINI